MSPRVGGPRHTTPTGPRPRLERIGAPLYNGSRLFRSPFGPGANAARDRDTAITRQLPAGGRPGFKNNFAQETRWPSLATRQRPMLELFLRYRTDPLALGGVMHRLDGDLRADLARDLAEQAGRAGLTMAADWVDALADNLTGACLSAIEARLSGRGPGAEESARLLAAFTTGACLGVIEASRSHAEGRHPQPDRSDTEQ